MCLKNGLKGIYRDVFNELVSEFSKKEFTFKEVNSKINNYTLSIHRRFTSNEVISKIGKRPNELDGLWRFKVNQEALTTLNKHTKTVTRI